MILSSLLRLPSARSRRTRAGTGGTWWSRCNGSGTSDAHYPGARHAEHPDEPVRVGPTVEADAEHVVLEHPVHLGEGRIEPPRLSSLVTLRPFSERYLARYGGSVRTMSTLLNVNRGRNVRQSAWWTASGSVMEFSYSFIGD